MTERQYRAILGKINDVRREVQELRRLLERPGFFFSGPPSPSEKPRSECPSRLAEGHPEGRSEAEGLDGQSGGAKMAWEEGLALDQSFT